MRAAEKVYRKQLHLRSTEIRSALAETKEPQHSSDRSLSSALTKIALHDVCYFVCMYLKRPVSSLNTNLSCSSRSIHCVKFILHTIPCMAKCLYEAVFEIMSWIDYFFRFFTCWWCS